MTEAGWTREKPTAHGWYFYKDKDGFIDVVAVRRVDSYGGPNLHEVVITVEKTTAVYQKNLHSKVSDLDGEWLGPLTPDSYQQGRVAGLEEASDIADEHNCKTWSECCDCGGEIRKEIKQLIAQQAQGGVADVHGR